MPNLRHERVRELLKRALGEVLRREFPVNEVGIITVNDLEVGGDLKSAVVFITILGNAEQQKLGLHVLEENRIRIQGLVARSVVLKYTPRLRFLLDDSIARGNRVLSIINELEQSSPADSEDQKPQAEPIIPSAPRRWRASTARSTSSTKGRSSSSWNSLPSCRRREGSTRRSSSTRFIGFRTLFPF